MLSIKEMPAQEKYIKFLRSAGLTDEFVPQMIAGAGEGYAFSCQVCHPLWLSEQFNVGMETVRNGKSCDPMLSPIKH